MSIIDPDTQQIKAICQSMIGSKIHFGFTITLPTGETQSGKINNCNIIGDCLENILFPIIKKQVSTFEEGPSQASPDFYNRKEWEWELKAFHTSAGFDIGSITGYIDKLSKKDGIEKKLFKTKYLVFEYDIDDNNIILKNFWMLSVWDLCCGYGGKKPINVGGGKGVNIRPGTKNQWSGEKTKEKRNATNFLDRIEILIQSKWYTVEDIKKKQNLLSIKTQRTALNI
jgi:hypothetical protein